MIPAQHLGGEVYVHGSGQRDKINPHCGAVDLPVLSPGFAPLPSGSRFRQSWSPRLAEKGEPVRVRKDS
jgi:hypothetical protein